MYPIGAFAPPKPTTPPAVYLYLYRCLPRSAAAIALTVDAAERRYDDASVRQVRHACPAGVPRTVEYSPLYSNNKYKYCTVQFTEKPSYPSLVS